MFDRKKYKDFAKQMLKNRYGVLILISLIISVITYLLTMPGTIKIPDFDVETMSFSEIMFLISQEINVSSASSTFFTFIKSLILSIFEIAAINVYLKISRSPEKVSMKDFIEGFSNWGPAILAFLWQFLWIFLWTCLFIIPGIIKQIAYSQMYYIITEYEGISVRKAMKISMLITRGHKGDLFIMYLSFIGWGILCGLTLGIGYIFLKPYMDVSFVNAYHAMMKEALERGIIKPEELA